jgi:hypothetical protein
MNQIVKQMEENIMQQQQILNAYEQALRDVTFYKRILVQAMLTNNGILIVDPSKYDEAKELLNSNCTLEFGNGKVCIHKENGSIFEVK